MADSRHRCGFSIPWFPVRVFAEQSRSPLGAGVSRRGALARRLCQAVQDLIRGEALDVEYETRRDLTTEDYLLMARLKTGSLMGAACALGAAAAGACPEVVARMDRFGRSLGPAFQIADDLLGVCGA
ncbi:polyprenyl synthetase family protein [Amycolatopsis sp. NPDC023774]|uniref:polyprenyl synthetase family protein n=1 Tax=Amycolatopsis sp. NPDC023774 TaxID=3155015 RepID=UPI0033E19CEF